MRIENGIMTGCVNGVPIVQNLIPKSNKTSRAALPMVPKYLTQHNPATKASAKNLTSYIDNAVYEYKSWHITLYPDIIYQELPLNENSWNAGDGYSGIGNRKSISKEIAEIGDQDKVLDTSAMMDRILMAFYSIPLANNKPHKFWSNKYCPRVIFNTIGWDKYLELVEGVKIMKLKDGSIHAIKTINDVEYVAVNDIKEYLDIKESKKHYIEVVNANVLNVRDKDYNDIGDIYRGDRFEYLGMNGIGNSCPIGWYRIVFKGATSYVSNNFAKMVSEQDLAHTGVNKQVGKVTLLYGEPKIVVPFSKEDCGDYENCISGVFQWDNKPISHLFQNGVWFYNGACHGWLNQPESVIYKLKNGTYGMERAVNYLTLPHTEIEWAIGGMGVTNYDPKLEGFSGAQAGVLRKTGHTGIAITKDAKVVGFYAENMDAIEVKEFSDSQGFLCAIMLDGGHIAAINSDIKKANLWQRQNNLIQFIQE